MKILAIALRRRCDKDDIPEKTLQGGERENKKKGAGAWLGRAWIAKYPEPPEKNVTRNERSDEYSSGYRRL